MKVFSSWGEIIFYSKDIDKPWDGTFKGAPAPGGAYPYVIAYSTMVNDKPFSEVVHGVVKLIK